MNSDLPRLFNFAHNQFEITETRAAKMRWPGTRFRVSADIFTMGSTDFADHNNE
jgi:hypothetical protein